jgi:hypothetical protein
VIPVSWNASLSHQVEVATVAAFAESRLGADPTTGLSVPDWLILTGQGVLEVTAGPVFIDTTGELARVRALLRWYPPDIERYVLAAGWQRISQPAWQATSRRPLRRRAGGTGRAAWPVPARYCWAHSAAAACPPPR